MVAVGIGVCVCEQRPLGAQDSAHPPALASGRCSGEAPPLRTGLHSKLGAVLIREVPGANGGGERDERKNRPAGTEGQAQEKEGARRPGVCDLEKIMIRVCM